MAQAGFEPPSLSVGTEVSAKYRGAFCEATVKTVVRVVKCKVVTKDGQSSIFVADEEIKGTVKVGSVVEVKHPETGQPVEATINKLIDHSVYTVVFDDGDERTLRRTQLCLKGDKHFIESETLDNLPLSHPEHFGTPVLQSKKAKRRNDDESDEEEERSEDESPQRAVYRGRNQELVGKLMLLDLPNRKGSAIPVLIVLPDATNLIEVKNRDQILTRSFKDSKFMAVARKNLKDFSRAVAIKNDDRSMKAAFERALLYHDTKELPVGWDRKEMLGSCAGDDTDDDDDEYASEDEPFEEKDRFVAQLYKFMDERGTPINKGPCIGNKDLNLYRLFKIVQNLGGYNKVSKEMKWSLVYSKMGLPSLHLNPAHQIKAAYTKYLDAFETFYRKLGSTMGTMSRPGRGRQNSGGRSILSFRAREKLPRSPKPPEKAAKSKDVTESAKQESEVVSDKSEDSQDMESMTSSDDGDVVVRRTPRRYACAVIPKEGKDKKEEPEKAKKEEPEKAKKEEPEKAKKEEPEKAKKEEPEKAKKEEPEKAKKEEPAKSKKDEKIEEVVDKTPASKTKKVATPAPKLKKDDLQSGPKAKKAELMKGKKEGDLLKKEERKSARKVKVEEEKESEKEDKKPGKGVKREKEDEEKEEAKQDTVEPVKDPSKKRMTRRKLLTTSFTKEPQVKEAVEEKKVLTKKPVTKETKMPDKKEKEIPRTLERRDSRASDKKDQPGKADEKKDKPGEKKVKLVEEKKLKVDKKGKESGEGSSDDGKPPSVPTPTEGVEFDQEPPDFPIGSRLRVKYGRGKNQKIYVAKVIDHGKDGVNRTYLVHYAGWNTRYDEWIRPDRVVSVLDRPKAERENARSPPTRLASGPLSMKPTMGSPKISSSQDKPGQNFRTPKMLANARTTRSSSSDTSIISRKIVHSHSVLSNSAGSRSPESHMSSDADDASNSEPADDDNDDESVNDTDGYDNMKEGSIENDMQDTEDFVEIDEPEEMKSPEMETVVEERKAVKDEPAPTVEKLEEERADIESENDVKDEKLKEIGFISHTASKNSTEVDISIKEEQNEEDKNSLEIESLKEDIDKSVVDVIKTSGISDVRPEKPSVVVAEVREAIQEIRYSVYLGEDVNKEENEEKSIKIEADVTSDMNIKPPELECMERKNLESQEDPGEKADLQSDQSDHMPEETAAAAFEADQAAPQLKLMDAEIQKRDGLAEKTKHGRGKKGNIKDGKKSFKISDIADAVTTPKLPTSEPILSPGKLEPSPYDFDAEMDTPWQPEITKKWEPSQKAPTVVKEGKESLEFEEDDEKEKKKVKKKVKKKPVSLTVTDDDKNVCMDETFDANTSEEVLVSPSIVESSTDAKGSKKKGRKKKELSTETKKEVIELYESTVNSVVEAVKHSLQETESDQEQRPVVKRRRIKHVSESDKKDITEHVTKVGRKVANRISLTAADKAAGADGLKTKKDRTSLLSESPPENVSVPSGSAQSSELLNGSATDVEAEKCIGSKDINKETGISESPGFEPQSENDAAAHFDNTPPTTPEHDEEEENKSGAAAAQRPENLCHPVELSSSEPSKDGGKVLCSSSVLLPTSSSSLTISKSATESLSDSAATSTVSTDSPDTALSLQRLESNGTGQDVVPIRKRNTGEGASSCVTEAKKRRIHGTRSRTAKKSPKYAGNSDSQGSASNTPNHCPESPPNRFADLSKSPRPSKYNFSADLGEYLEGEAKCNFLIGKMREIKAIYMNLKAEVASIDRRRKRARKKERETSQALSNDRDMPT